MNEKTNILIVGAGAQGAPCAAILARQLGVGRILLGTQKLADAAPRATGSAARKSWPLSSTRGSQTRSSAPSANR
jgi:hypothetical protein